MTKRMPRQSDHTRALPGHRRAVNHGHKGYRMRSVQTVLLAACLVASAHAEIVGVVDGVDADAGTLIELHDTAGLCVSGTLYALYRAALPSTVSVPGCWVMMGRGSVMAAFLDGSAYRIQISAVRKPATT